MTQEAILKLDELLRLLEGSKLEGNQSKLHEKDENKPIIFEITGYGKFANVLDNPSKRLIENLKKKVENSNNQNNPFLPNVVINSTTIMHCSGKQILKSIDKLRNEHNIKYGSNYKVVYIHTGVDDRRDGCYLENTAKNIADFRLRDESGWQPKQEMIIKENGNLNHSYMTRLDTTKLKNILKSKPYNYNCGESNDAGTFMCNFAFYYQSHLCAGNNNEYTLFVHVPEYKDLNQTVQLNFFIDLINQIAKSLS